MSYDLSIAKGDLSISNGELKVVRHGTKLSQDILKILHIPLGSDPFFPQKGTTLTSENIGVSINQEFVESRATASIEKALLLIQNVQQFQIASGQTVTAEETLKDINEVKVTADELDPRQYNINITVITGAYSAIEIPEFSLSTSINDFE